MKHFLITACWILLLAGYGLADCRIAQSTSGTLKIGPFIDDTDFKTAETALTIQKADVRISKNGATEAAASADQGASDAGAPHLGSGNYGISYNTTDTNTTGLISFTIKESGALVAWRDCEVYEPTATVADIHNYPKASITDVNGIGYWLKTNADVPTSQYSMIKNKTTIATLSSQTSWTLTAGSSNDNAYNGWLVIVQNASTAEQMAVGVVEDYTGSTRTVTLRTDPAVFTMAVGDVVYLVPDRSLKSTVDNRPLDVSATGEAGIDWANIGSPTTTVNLSGTTVKDATDVQTDTNAILAAVDVVDNFVDTEIAAINTTTTAIKVKTDFLPSVTAGGAGGLFIAGTNAATTVTTAFTTTFTGNLTGSVASVTGGVGGNVTGSVGSVTGAVGSVTGTIGGLSAAALADFFDTNSGVTFSSAVGGSVVKEIVDNAGGAELTTTSIADAVWDELIAGHLGAGSTGEKLNAAASAGDPWTTALPGAYSAGSAGFIMGTNLNALVSTRASQTSVDAVQADTDDLQTRIPIALTSGRMDVSIGAMQTGVLTAAAIGADAFTAAKFAADASTEFATTLMGTTYEGSETFKHFLQYGASFMFGKYNTPSSGTANFRDLADTKNRLVFTLTPTARTAVTRNPD